MAGRSHTFNDKQMDEIGRENLHLLNRLARVATRAPAVGAPSNAPTVKSSFEINRLRQAREIEEANMRLLRKLQTTKSDVKRHMGDAAGSRSSSGYTVKKPTVSRPAHGSRPEWDNSAGAGLAPTGASQTNSAPTQRQFKSRDLAEIALEACPERHLYK